MNLAKYLRLLVIASAALLAGCLNAPWLNADRVPEKLIVHRDGSMELDHKPVSPSDVVFYPDGYGGEKAAVRVRLEPVHPDFFRDTIVVVRK